MKSKYLVYDCFYNHRGIQYQYKGIEKVDLKNFYHTFLCRFVRQYTMKFLASHSKRINMELINITNLERIIYGVK